MRGLTVLLLAAAMLTGCDQLQPDNPDGTTRLYSTCIDHSGGVSVEIHDCMAKEFGRQDDRLNAVYKAAMARLSGERRNRLRLEERDWLKTTKAACEAAVGEDEQGTAAPLAIDDCWIEQTIKRTRTLQARR